MRTPSTRSATTCRSCRRPTRIACRAQVSTPSSRHQAPLKPTTPPSRMPSSPYRAAITLTPKYRSASTESRRRNALVNPSASRRYNTGLCATRQWHPWWRTEEVMLMDRTCSHRRGVSRTVCVRACARTRERVHVHASVCTQACALTRARTCTLPRLILGIALYYK